ncbi:unnamed protein product [Medioppia subpectinata]|uniref:Uncharacterized protein n=1 Tax=Medioppia subpectinata TaxID=1979941 RepID=A0A7R9KK21_9ACAR|nr:unnamed protein product [Medioppia subpectinata]CAG2103618.1 unnamed protein product [Medioppia subpectinata]
MLKKLTCFQNNDCEITAQTRNMCRKCRLAKCLTMGMKKEWIFNDEMKALRKQKIETTKKRRQLTDNNQALHTGAYIDIPANNTPINSSSRCITICTPLTDYRVAHFNELEGNRLRELLLASRIFVEQPGLNNQTALLLREHDVIRVIGQRFMHQITRLVHMFRNITAFSNVCENDRISLIKYGFLELFIMRALPHYDCRRDHWIYELENGNSIVVNLGVMKIFRRNIYHWFKVFHQSMCSEWDSDPVVLDLLTAIIMFNPNRPNLFHPETIILQQQIYLYLLKRYLLLRYGNEGYAVKKHDRLVTALGNLREVAARHRRNCEETDPVIVPYQLLREIFDIKSDANITQTEYCQNKLDTPQSCTLSATKRDM